MFVNFSVLRDIEEFRKCWIIALLLSHQVWQNTIACCSIGKLKTILLFLLLLKGKLHQINWQLIVIFKSIINDQLNQFYIILLENGDRQPYHQPIHVFLYRAISSRACLIAAADTAGVMLRVLALKSDIIGGIYPIDII